MYPFESLDYCFDAPTNRDGPANIIPQTAKRIFGCHFFFAFAKEVPGTVIVFDRSEGMLAGLLALFLFGNVPADKNHNAFFGAGHFSEIVQVFAGCSIDGNLLQRVLA